MKTIQKKFINWKICIFTTLMLLTNIFISCSYCLAESGIAYLKGTKLTGTFKGLTVYDESNTIKLTMDILQISKLYYEYNKFKFADLKTDNVYVYTKWKDDDEWQKQEGSISVEIPQDGKPIIEDDIVLTIIITENKNSNTPFHFTRHLISQKSLSTPLIIRPGKFVIVNSHKQGNNDLNVVGKLTMQLVIGREAILSPNCYMKGAIFKNK